MIYVNIFVHCPSSLGSRETSTSARKVLITEAWVTAVLYNKICDGFHDKPSLHEQGVVPVAGNHQRNRKMKGPPWPMEKCRFCHYQSHKPTLRAVVWWSLQRLKGELQDLLCVSISIQGTSLLPSSVKVPGIDPGILSTASKGDLSIQVVPFHLRRAWFLLNCLLCSCILFMLSLFLFVVSRMMIITTTILLLAFYFLLFYFLSAF